ncbi:putative DNA base hypermodification protein [Sphingomonas aerolata]|uniref:nucleotide kinase domain-containing protein n=1 Tax=Sphingomonas aerolata TaxID=185951 RepID=UPI0035A71644
MVKTVSPSGRKRGRPAKIRSEQPVMLELALTPPADHAPVASRAPTVVSLHLAPAKTTAVYDSYWRFAAERQRVFYRRVLDQPWPWTDNSVLGRYKFTNAYRASDRVSQFLIRNVIYRDDLPDTATEVVFRILLFKLFNKIETWQRLEREVGPITFEEYQFGRYDDVLSRAMAQGKRIYSAAYIMPPGSSAFGCKAKHQNHLKLLETMMRDELPNRLAAARSMQTGFELLRAYPTIGDFLAYQFITDVNYSDVTAFSEMDFVIPGPGAKDGLRKCFADPGGLSDAELIRLMADRQNEECARLGLELPSLWGRPLQLIDCQNLFCEVDKYARVAHPEASGLTGRTRIKQKFAAHSEPMQFWYPPKWEINDRIAAGAVPNEAFVLAPSPASDPRDDDA